MLEVEIYYFDMEIYKLEMKNCISSGSKWLWVLGMNTFVRSGGGQA